MQKVPYLTFSPKLVRLTLVSCYNLVFIHMLQNLWYTVYPKSMYGGREEGRGGSCIKLNSMSSYPPFFSWLIIVILLWLHCSILSTHIYSRSFFFTEYEIKYTHTYSEHETVVL